MDESGEADNSDEIWKGFFNKAPTIEGAEKKAKQPVTFLQNFTGFFSLIPKTELKFFHCDGSLTTPPCSPIVTWFVFQDPIVLSKSVWKQFVDSQAGLPDNVIRRRALDVCFDIEGLPAGFDNRGGCSTREPQKIGHGQAYAGSVSSG